MGGSGGDGWSDRSLVSEVVRLANTICTTSTILPHGTNERTGGSRRRVSLVACDTRLGWSLFESEPDQHVLAVREFHSNDVERGAHLSIYPQRTRTLFEMTARYAFYCLSPLLPQGHRCALDPARSTRERRLSTR